MKTGRSARLVRELFERSRVERELILYLASTMKQKENEEESKFLFLWHLTHRCVGDAMSSVCLAQSSASHHGVWFGLWWIKGIKHNCLSPTVGRF